MSRVMELWLGVGRFVPGEGLTSLATLKPEEGIFPVVPSVQGAPVSLPLVAEIDLVLAKELFYNPSIQKRQNTSPALEAGWHDRHAA